MKMDIVAGSKNDEFYTPVYAIEPIIPYAKRFNMFKNNEFEIMYFNKRVAYFKNYDDPKPSLNPPFSSVYLCHKMLDKQIVFKEINK